MSFLVTVASSNNGVCKRSDGAETPHKKTELIAAQSSGAISQMQRLATAETT